MENGIIVRKYFPVIPLGKCPVSPTSIILLVCVRLALGKGLAA